MAIIIKQNKHPARPRQGTDGGPIHDPSIPASIARVVSSKHKLPPRGRRPPVGCGWVWPVWLVYSDGDACAPVRVSVRVSLVDRQASRVCCPSVIQSASPCVCTHLHCTAQVWELRLSMTSCYFNHNGWFVPIWILECCRIWLGACVTRPTQYVRTLIHLGKWEWGLANHHPPPLFRLFIIHLIEIDYLVYAMKHTCFYCISWTTDFKVLFKLVFININLFHLIT